MITRLFLVHTTIGAIFQDPVPGSQRIYTNGTFEMCEVRKAPIANVCEVAPNTRLKQLLAVENKTILQQLNR